MDFYIWQVPLHNTLLLVLYITNTAKNCVLLYIVDFQHILLYFQSKFPFLECSERHVIVYYQTLLRCIQTLVLNKSHNFHFHSMDYHIWLPSCNIRLLFLYVAKTARNSVLLYIMSFQCISVYREVKFPFLEGISRRWKAGNRVVHMPNTTQIHR